MDHVLHGWIKVQKEGEAFQEGADSGHTVSKVEKCLHVCNRQIVTDGKNFQLKRECISR